MASGSSFAHGNSGDLVQPLGGNGKRKRSIGVKIDGSETNAKVIEAFDVQRPPKTVRA